MGTDRQCQWQAGKKCLHKQCKQSMGTLGSNISDRSVSRIGKSIGQVMEVSQQFDRTNGVREDSGRHPRRTVEADMKKLVTQLHADSHYHPKRKHAHFKRMQANMTANSL